MKKIAISLKLMLICSLIFETNVSFSQDFFGAIIDTAAESRKIKVNYSITRGEDDALPASHSLIVFAPEVKNQGRIPSCVSWASAYAGLTIVKRIEKGSLDIEPFSAMNLYNRVRAYDNLKSCKSGSLFESNLKLLYDKGCASHMDFYETCEFLPYSKDYENTLYDYEDLELNSENIRYSIAKNRPVMVGMKTYRKSYWGSMFNHPTGVWDGLHEGNWVWNHGMLIIGYDDTLSGGSFLVMNSWGKEFGKDGFFWLQYENVEEELLCAYAMIPEYDNSYKVLHNTTRGASEIEIIAERNALETFEITNANTNYSDANDTNLILKNQCGFDFYIAIGVNGAHGEFSKGWYSLERFSTEQIPVNAADSLFIYLENQEQKITEIQTQLEHEKSFSIDNQHSFFFTEKDSLSNASFVELNYPNEDLTASIYCLNKPTLCIQIVQDGNVEINEVVNENQKWNGVSLLFDPITNEPIFPK
jgi:hypothetical protein